MLQYACNAAANQHIPSLLPKFWLVPGAQLHLCHTCLQHPLQTHYQHSGEKFRKIWRFFFFIIIIIFFNLIPWKKYIREISVAFGSVGVTLPPDLPTVVNTVQQKKRDPKKFHISFGLTNQSRLAVLSSAWISFLNDSSFSVMLSVTVTAEDALRVCRPPVRDQPKFIIPGNFTPAKHFLLVL